MTSVKRSTTTWQQTKGPPSPVLSPASLAASFHVLEVMWDSISCTEYAKRRSYGNLCSQVLESLTLQILLVAKLILPSIAEN